MKITKSELQQVIREAIKEEMEMYDPPMTVEGLLEVIRELDAILLEMYQVHGDTEAQRAHHMLDKLLGR